MRLTVSLRQQKCVAPMSYASMSEAALAATEARDTMAATATVPVQATLAVTEARDTMATSVQVAMGGGQDVTYGADDVTYGAEQVTYGS